MGWQSLRPKLALMPLLTHGTDIMAVDTVMDMDSDITDIDTVDTTVTPTTVDITDTTWARGPLMPNLRPMLTHGTDITDMDTDTVMAVTMVDTTAVDTTVTPDTDTVMAVTTVRKLATKTLLFSTHFVN